jgi:hypothetical protein
MLDSMTGKQPAPRGVALLALLQERDGRPSEVALRDGRRLMIFNIAWGYDIGDEFSHVTTNVSPHIGAAEIDFFFTEDVASVVDPETGVVLFQGS